MKKRIFAIVGYTHWGKSNTLYELFGRKGFQPLKSPITSKYLGDKLFTVINASNEDKPTKEYLKRLDLILERHRKIDTNFIITISLNFDERHDVITVFEKLNSLKDYEVTYLVINNSWHGGHINPKDFTIMEGLVSKSKILYFDTVIKKSKERFKERTELIAKEIKTRIQPTYADRNSKDNFLAG